MKKINAIQFALFAGLPALLSVGVASADGAERCRNGCAVDLESCRGQAETTAEFEAHPILAERSKSAVYGNGQLSSLIRDGGAAPDAEIQRRKLERYQQCATENRDCQAMCSSAQAPSKRSLVLK